MKYVIILALLLAPIVGYTQDSTHIALNDTVRVLPSIKFIPEKMTPEKKGMYISLGAIVTAAGIIVAAEGISEQKTNAIGKRTSDPDIVKTGIGGALAMGGIYMILKGLHGK